MKKLFSLTLSLLMLIACSLGTVSAFAAEGEEPAPVDLRDCTVTLQYASTTYTGKALRPSVKVQYNDTALIQGQDYKVQYSANTACGTAQVKLTGTGDYTGAVSRSFKILPGRVTGMSTSRTTTTITVNWKQVPGAAVYRVYQSTSANGNYSKVATVSGTKAKISKLSAGKKYYFKIAACGKKDGSYAGPLSAVLNTGTRPSTVSMKSVTKSGTNLKIRWNKVTCSGYEVRYSTDKKMKKGVKTVKITKSSATSTTIKKIKKGSTYYAQVRAYLSFPNKVYNGSYSKVTSSSYSNLYASYSSKYVNNKDRTTNLRIASKAIDGTVIQPGQTFSFNKVVGKRTKSRGYKEAYVFSGSGTVMGVGGGICQVSTTLYVAVLKAELEVTERYSHSMIVHYVDPSMDAAIAEGLKDLKFINNTDAPIYIEASADGSTLHFAIYGHETRDPNRTVRYESETTNTEDPTPSLTEDANASFGTIEQTSYGYQGSTARLWKIVNDNGNETKEQVNSSTYRMTSDVYTVGTKTDNAAARAEMQAAIAANDLAKAKEVAAKYSQSSSSSSSSEKKEDSSDDSDSDGTEKTDDSSDTEKTEDDED